MLSSQVQADPILEYWGDSEIASVMRGLDWNATALGSPDSWSFILRNIVGISLVSATPMCVIWGADVVVLYNDAWANRLGLTNHASVLARSGHEVWKPLWDQVGGAIERVKADQATSMLEEVAYENEHLALALVPIWGDRDRVDGVLVEIREVA